jgi:hypothetical protein
MHSKGEGDFFFFFFQGIHSSLIEEGSRAQTLLHYTKSLKFFDSNHLKEALMSQWIINGKFPICVPIRRKGLDTSILSSWLSFALWKASQSAVSD